MDFDKIESVKLRNNLLVAVMWCFIYQVHQCEYSSVYGHVRCSLIIEGTVNSGILKPIVVDGSFVRSDVQLYYVLSHLSHIVLFHVEELLQHTKKEPETVC